MDAVSMRPLRWLFQTWAQGASAEMEMFLAMMEMDTGGGTRGLPTWWRRNVYGKRSEGRRGVSSVVWSSLVRHPFCGSAGLVRMCVHVT